MRTVKRERSTGSAAAGIRGSGGGGGGGGGGKDRVLREIKRERIRVNSETATAAEEEPHVEQGVEERRILRSKYRALRHRIDEERDDLTNVDSKTFGSFIKEFDTLHKDVRKPREQVADAEALLGLTTTLVTSVKARSSDGITVGGFVTKLMNSFGHSTPTLGDEENSPVSIAWKEIGLFVSPAFRRCSGFSTMLGPMNTEMKLRKHNVTQRPRTRPGQSTRPEEVDDTGAEERTDTDKNMAAMFGILKSKKRVRLDCLILNRRSFAQTVENLFALSFLVKDGRVEIVVDEDGNHFVLPRNAPASESVMSKEVAYRHFVFRFDFRDWQMMIAGVPDGEELMPNRDTESSAADMSQGTAADNMPPGTTAHTEDAQPRTPIRKLTRNRGLVVQNDTVEETPQGEEEDEEEEDGNGARKGLHRCKRRLV
ncbi:unnamed protein product [Linum tenue]|uniref:Non-structural maintenance of chromosomes element 4 n=1 Tax=Linum tenue TaxID=586396 RepID=A0AAV0M4G1_9ROSI|nr:unnamed protein product [Linum tenue]